MIFQTDYSSIAWIIGLGLMFALAFSFNYLSSRLHQSESVSQRLLQADTYNFRSLTYYEYRLRS
ncbi:unnamed protein product, partial [marine sediment metagenome]